MNSALNAAIETYADMSGMSKTDVAKEIQQGNQVIRRTVMMLLFAAA